MLFLGLILVLMPAIPCILYAKLFQVKQEVGRTVDQQRQHRESSAGNWGEQPLLGNRC